MSTEAAKRVLVIGAHNDDPEFNAGGLVARLHQLGWEARFICVSHFRRYSKKYQGTDVEKTYTDPEQIAEYLRQDHLSAEILGADKIHLYNPGNGHRTSYNQEDVFKLIDLIEEFNPDLALIHWPHDNHYEHVQSAKLAMHALSQSSCTCEVLAFEGGPWQTSVYFNPDFIVNITPVMDTLNESLSVYNQLSANGKGLVKEKKVLSEYRGYMGGFINGEAYKILRFPCGKDPEMILPKLLGKDFRWGGSRQYMFGEQYLF